MNEKIGFTFIFAILFLLPLVLAYQSTSGVVRTIFGALAVGIALYMTTFWLL